MALGAATINTSAGAAASAPTFIDDLSFAGDGTYPSGGTAAFQAYVRAKFKNQRTVLGVIDIAPNATYYPVYDRTNDKLKIYVRATGVENATADISAQTFRVLVISK